MNHVTLHNGDSREYLKTLAPDSIDSCVCDPPYELTSARPGGRSPSTEGKVMRGFMGLKWDATGISFDPTFWAEVYRVLKPGAYLLAFSGTRTSHRMVSAIENAGFEIRDQISWWYATGFPKSLNAGKAIDTSLGAKREVVGKVRRWGNGAGKGRGGQYANDYEPTERGAERFDPITAPATELAKQYDGWGTALKPAHEPICVARKPLVSTIADNLMLFGTGAMNIDACRIAGPKTPAPVGEFVGSNIGPTGLNGTRDGSSDHLGRWPANVVMDETVASMLDEQSGECGGASRFFFVAKPSRKERDAGCDKLPSRVTEETVDRDPDSAGVQSPRAGAGRGAGAVIYACAVCGLNLQGGRRATECYDGAEHTPIEVGRGDRVKNFHATVKPIELMRYLIRLVTPKHGTVIDPFMGSGTTGCAAQLEEMEFIGCELDPDYMVICEARIAYWQREATSLFNQEWFKL